MEKAITGDFSLIKGVDSIFFIMIFSSFPNCYLVLPSASKVDTLGNAQFNGTSRNFNPPIATAGRICIVEADEIVEPGDIRPEDVHLPGIYVDRIVKSETERIFEKKTFFVRLAFPSLSLSLHSLSLCVCI
jgi:hypothetical protein